MKRMEEDEVRQGARRLSSSLITAREGEKTRTDSAEWKFEDAVCL